MSTTLDTRETAARDMRLVIPLVLLVIFVQRAGWRTVLTPSAAIRTGWRSSKRGPI